MTTSLVSPKGLFQDLPKLIGLPRCLPVRREFPKVPLEQVLVPKELPPYLLLGTLDPRTFQSSTGGWSAQWIGDAPDTRVEARFDRGEQRLELRQVWRGVEGGHSYTPGGDFGRALQLLYLQFPETWDRMATERLESAYRLKYMPTSSLHLSMAGIPDGAFKTIGVPVAASRLHDVYGCLAEMSRDPQLRTPVGGRLELKFSTVNYVTGRGAAWTGDPLQLFAASCAVNGLLPLGLPQLEHGKDGTSAWTLRRLVYLAQIEVPFAGLEFVVERLASRGLIRRKGCEAGVEPGVEFDAFVGPAAMDLQMQSCAWMDAGGTRRVFYLLYDGDESADGGVERMLRAHGQSEEVARGLIEEARRVAANQIAWLQATRRTA